MCCFSTPGMNATATHPSFLFLARARRSRGFAERVRKRAESILERSEERPDALVVLSNALDPERPDSRTGQRMRKLEEDFDVIDWPIFDECPHEPDSRCPQPLWRIQIVRRLLRKARVLAKLRELSARGKLLVMGQIAFETLHGTSEFSGELPFISHASVWHHPAVSSHTYAILCARLPSFYDQDAWSAFLAATHTTSCMRRASSQTMSWVKHLPASAKQKAATSQQNRTRIASARARAASSAVGKVAGRLRLTGSARQKMGRKQSLYLATEKGRAVQAAKAAHMAAVRDETETQAKATEAKRKMWALVSVIAICLSSPKTAASPPRTRSSPWPRRQRARQQRNTAQGLAGKTEKGRPAAAGACEGRARVVGCRETEKPLFTGSDISAGAPRTRRRLSNRFLREKGRDYGDVEAHK